MKTYKDSKKVLEDIKKGKIKNNELIFLDEREFLSPVTFKELVLQKIKKLESQVKELKEKHIFMEEAIKKKAGMLEPVRKESWRFHK